MNLKELKPSPGSTTRHVRVGRGVGSGIGKTSGRGHKGKGSRTGGNTPPGYEGGQMPLQRRLPKRGFVSHLREDTAEVRLTDLAKLPVVEIDLLALKAAGVVPAAAKTAKIIRTGKLEKPVKLSGMSVTKGARSAIEAAGGSITGEPVRKTVEPAKQAPEQAKQAAGQAKQAKQKPAGEAKQAG